MRVFVGWSGALSKEMAGILRTYLPKMIQDLEVFTSHHDLPSGARWSLELARELQDAVFGILCLTPDNLHSDWLLFEAGALSTALSTKMDERRVCCLLFSELQAKDLSDPLAQFQNQVFGREGMRSLVRDLNKSIPRSLQDIDVIFDKWWQDIEAAHNEVTATRSLTAKRERSEREVLDEILLKVRGIARSFGSKTGRTVAINLDPATYEDHGPEDQE